MSKIVNYNKRFAQNCFSNEINVTLNPAATMTITPGISNSL